MPAFRTLFFALCLAAAAQPNVLTAAARVLETRPLPSPDRKYVANVEWDDVGFIGLIRMRINLPNGDPFLAIELPEINPSPANLAWLNDEWVACESFIGDRGSGFFYVHIPTKRAYLIEIVVAKPDSDWMLSFTTNDALSSAAVRTISRKRDSLFPILLRDLPTDGADYFDVAFVEDLRMAMDDFASFRKQSGFRKFELLGDADIHTSIGAITIANFNDRAEAVYFPAGTTTPQEMLAKVKRQPLTSASQELLNGINAPIPEARWKNISGAYEVRGVHRDETTVPVVLGAGQFDGVSDQPYSPPVDEQTVQPAGSKKDATSKASRKSSNSSGKKPSRSK